MGGSSEFAIVAMSPAEHKANRIGAYIERASNPIMSGNVF